MIREKILSEYRVNEHGVIQNPGKFEGERLYVPYFWDKYLDGFGRPEDSGAIGFNVTPEDLAEFPELDGSALIFLLEDEQGFVSEV